MWQGGRGFPPIGVASVPDRDTWGVPKAKAKLFPAPAVQSPVPGSETKYFSNFPASSR
jgi:hypothetical protein